MKLSEYVQEKSIATCLQFLPLRALGSTSQPCSHVQVEDMSDTDIRDMGYDYMISPKATLPGYARLMPCQESSSCRGSH